MSDADVLDRPYSLGQTAKAVRVSKGTVASWRSRGHIKQTEYSLSDVLSLNVAVQLMRFGLHIEPAAEIGFQLKPYWSEFIMRQVDDPPLWLVVRPGGAEVMFEWDVLDADTLIERFQDDNVIVNLKTAFLGVMAELRVPTAERVTSNGSYILSADPAPERDDREFA